MSNYMSGFSGREVDERLGSIPTIVELLKKGLTSEHISNDAITSEKIKNGSVNTSKLVDAAVTGDKIADKSIKDKHLSYEVINKMFDGGIAVYVGDSVDLNSIDNREYPSGFSIYKLIDDFDLASYSGILIVHGRCNPDYSLESLYQTRINAITGEVLYRHSLAVEGNRATSWSEWKSRYISSIPVADNAGTAGIVKLGKLNGLIIDKDMLVVDYATTAEIQFKSSTRKPIVPTGVAYALAMNTHQSLDDSYNPDNFQVVHSSKNEATYFPTDKDRLPVSYKAVKEALADVSGGLKLVTAYDLDWTATGYSGVDVSLAEIDMSNTDEFYGRFIVSSLNRKHADGIFNVYINKSQAIYDIEWEMLSNKAERYPDLMIGDEAVIVGNLFSVWMRADAHQPVAIQCHMINSSDDTIVSGGYNNATEEPFDGMGSYYLRGTSPKDRLTQIEQKLEQL